MIGANVSDRPVFIVGMPRSGTSLAEQILASHPAVFGAGELMFWGTAMQDPAVLKGEINKRALRDLADQYLNIARRDFRGRTSGSGQNANQLPLAGFDSCCVSKCPHHPYAAQPHRYLSFNLFSEF